MKIVKEMKVFKVTPAIRGEAILIMKSVANHEVTPAIRGEGRMPLF